MLNKTILVFYINVGNSSSEEAKKIVESVRDSVTLKDGEKEHAIQYIIPVRDQETKVECINAPVYISSKEKLEEFEFRIEKINKKLDRITAHINAENEIRNVLTEKKIK